MDRINHVALWILTSARHAFILKNARVMHDCGMNHALLCMNACCVYVKIQNTRVIPSDPFGSDVFTRRAQEVRAHLSEWRGVFMPASDYTQRNSKSRTLVARQ